MRRMLDAREASAAAGRFPNSAMQSEKDGGGDLGLGFGPFSSARFWQPAFSSVGAAVSAASRQGVFPFTAAQWQELQRQALIYKHMVAAVAVPAELLHPSAAKSFPDSPSIYLSSPPARATVMVGGGGGLSARFPGGGADLEPGRCRRTDGKKWRCARDAEPEQKYCDRHLNRGRPRSRKHVEHRRTRRKATPCEAEEAAAPVPPPADANALAVGGRSAAAGFLPEIDLSLPLGSGQANKDQRCQDGMENYPKNSVSNKQWGTMNSKTRLQYQNPDTQQYDQHPNLNCAGSNASWCPILTPEFSSFGASNVSECRELPRGFIDAWSSEDATNAAASHCDKSTTSCEDKLPLSNLTLSMSNYFGVHDDSIRSHPLNWTGDSSSPLGGPLAEVLQSSTITSPHNGGSPSNKKSRADISSLITKGDYGSHEVSPCNSPSRLASSPSGVLHRALVSFSDSSSSSSPTFGAGSRSDFVFQWMNLNK